MNTRHRGHRLIPLSIAILLLMLAGACVRSSSSTGTPSAAGNIARAQVVETTAPEMSPTIEPAATVEPVPTDTVVASATLTAAETVAAATAVPTATLAGPTPTAIPCRLGAFDDDLDVEVEERDDDNGSPRNGIKLCNRKDDRLRVKGRIQLNRVSRDRVEPVNESLAWASCKGCSTISVALQMNLVRRDAQVSLPVNKAVSYNYRCTGCRTFAISYQYIHQVDDPRYVPEDVRRLVDEMNREIKAVHAESNSITIGEAASRLDAVIARFQELNQGLDVKRDDRQESDTPGSGD